MPRFKYDKYQREQIRGEWLGEDKSCEELGRKYQVTDVTIHNYVEDIKRYRTRNFKNKSTRANEYVFHEINEKSAYWIGMLMADGCISSTETNKESKVILVLHRKDEDEILKFKEFTSFTGKVSYGKHKDKLTGKIIPYARIAIGSDIMAKELKKYGVREQKTLTAKIKLLENNSAFWTGAICGDGYIGVSSNLPKIEFSGTREICEQFKSFCNQFVDTDANVTPDKTIFRFRLNGYPAYDVIKKLFVNFSYGLERKVIKAHAIITKYGYLSDNHKRLQEAYEIIPKLRSEGMTLDKIGNIVGLTRQTVAKILKTSK